MAKSSIKTVKLLSWDGEVTIITKNTTTRRGLMLEEYFSEQRRREEHPAFQWTHKVQYLIKRESGIC